MIFLSRKMLGTMIGKSNRTLIRWSQLGKGPVAHQLGGQIMYCKDDVDAFIAKSRQSPKRKANAS